MEVVGEAGGEGGGAVGCAVGGQVSNLFVKDSVKLNFIARFDFAGSNS